MDKLERRIIPAEDGELRVEPAKNGKSATISGYGAIFNKDSANMGGFVERVAPGAFTNALKRSDVRALKNHDPNLVLGRTTSGTLAVTENTRGLKYVIDAPDTSTGKDVVEEIRRRDITGSSFSFTVKTEQWDERKDDVPVRTIIEFDEIRDVGPVTFPAYPDTTVAARSLEAFRSAKHDAEDAEAGRRGDGPPGADPPEGAPELTSGEPAPEPEESVEEAKNLPDKSPAHPAEESTEKLAEKPAEEPVEPTEEAVESPTEPEEGPNADAHRILDEARAAEAEKAKEIVLKNTAKRLST